jgi:hypothetical protein
MSVFFITMRELMKRLMLQEWGVYYPRNYAEFPARYPDAAACLDLASMDRRLCVPIVPARAPLTVWFSAALHMTTSSAKNCVSAKTLHRILGFSSYPTAWAILHRLRCAISHAGHDMLSGQVEVDEIVFGRARCRRQVVGGHLCQNICRKIWESLSFK